MAPGPAKEIFTSAIQNLQKSQGAAGILFIVGLAGALWSASGYVVAFMRASNAIYDVEEGRPIWKTAPVRLGVTLVLVLMLAIVAVGVVFTGGLAKQAGGVLGVSESAVTERMTATSMLSCDTPTPAVRRLRGLRPVGCRS